MNEIKKFVEQARAKGLTDERIKAMLMENGWKEDQIDLALLGMEVPTPPPTADVPKPRPQDEPVKEPAAREEKSIGALEAALQHVLLWVFTATSTVMLGIMSNVIFSASSEGSSDALTTYFVFELVTFIPFAALFGFYLYKLRKVQELKTGRVWSIITIVFHSLGLIGSLVALLLVALLADGGSAKNWGLVYTSLLAGMNAIVVIAYIAANFIHGKVRLRKVILTVFPAVLLTLVLAFGIYASTKFGPIEADAQTREQLVSVVEEVREYTEDNSRLPSRLSELDSDTEGLTYQRRSENTYTLCAHFETDRSSDDWYAQNKRTITDDYVSSYDFVSEQSGEHCFRIEATRLDMLRYPSSDFRTDVCQPESNNQDTMRCQQL